MLNLSIMPLFEDSVEAVCEDIIRQQREGITTYAMMTFNANPDMPYQYFTAFSMLNAAGMHKSRCAGGKAG